VWQRVVDGCTKRERLKDRRIMKEIVRQMIMDAKWVAAWLLLHGIRDEHPCSYKFFGLKISKYFDADPGSFQPWIRKTRADPGQTSATQFVTYTCIYYYDIWLFLGSYKSWGRRWAWGTIRWPRPLSTSTDSTCSTAS